MSQDATQIRLVNADLETLEEHLQTLKEALGSRFQIIKKARQGTRGEYLAFALVMPSDANN